MTINEIIELAVEHDLLTRSRKRDKVYKRFYIYSLLYRKKMTLERIAEVFQVNHSSVIYGINQHNVWIKNRDWIYLNYISELFEQANRFSIKHIKEDEAMLKVLDTEGDLITLQIKMHSTDHEGFMKISGMIKKELLREAI